MAKLCNLFSDETRIRILMLLTRKELCVCQIMGVLGISATPCLQKSLSAQRRRAAGGTKRGQPSLLFSQTRTLRCRRRLHWPLKEASEG
ncbi:MAG TPA: hypothetical protein DCP92_14235 [Nitrospiraceae bacterium]|nr:hypothetical protein [Nitrospiraceae bacterium]